MSNTAFLQKTPNEELSKKLNIAAWVVTVVVLLLVGMMREVKIPLPEGWDLHFLVPFHATLNALTAIVLVIGLVFIKQRNFKAHQNTMTLAMGLSALFLLSYVSYHFTTEATVFGDLDGSGGKLSPEELAEVGSMRTIYLILLITHIVLAAVIFPFILFTFIRASTNQFTKHRKMARWVYPLWLYVAITGPVLYWMLKPYYM